MSMSSSCAAEAAGVFEESALPEDLIAGYCTSAQAVALCEREGRQGADNELIGPSRKSESVQWQGATERAGIEGGIGRQDGKQRDPLHLLHAAR